MSEQNSHDIIEALSEQSERNALKEVSVRRHHE